MSLLRGGRTDFVQVVVRDLWALRLRSLVKKLDELPEGEDDAQASSSQAASDTEGEVDDTREQFMPRRASSTPRLVETLGLCYLGCLLLRLPTSVGDIYRYDIQLYTGQHKLIR